MFDSFCVKIYCFGILFVWFCVVFHLFVLRSYKNVSCFIWYFYQVSFFVSCLTFPWLSLCMVFCVSFVYEDVFVCFQCAFGSISVINGFFVKFCLERVVFSLKGSVMKWSVIKDCFAELCHRQNGCFFERYLLFVSKFFW